MIFTMRASHAIPWTQIISRTAVFANWAAREHIITISRTGEDIASNAGTRPTNHSNLKEMWANLSANATDAFVPTRFTGKLVSCCHC